MRLAFFYKMVLQKKQQSVDEQIKLQQNLIVPKIY
jgi:hypothetical protein